MKKKLLNDNVYGSNFWLIWDCSNKDVVLFLRKKFNDPEIHESETADASMFFLENRSGVCLWIENSEIDPTTIDHEIIHLCIYSFMCFDMKINYHTEEAFASYFAYIKRKVLAALAVKKKKK